MTFPVLSANGPTGYKLTRSLRFRSSASAYLNRTTTTTSNRTTWTMSMWLKRGLLGSSLYTPFAFGDNSTGSTDVGAFARFGSDALTFEEAHGGVDAFFLVTNQVFRDPSAWYHFVFVVDTTQATSTNRIKIYVNGVQITSFSTATYPSQNFATSANLSGNTPKIGVIDVDGAAAGQYFDGYLAEVNFIDGQALTPSSFGSTNSTTGVWQPAKYTGTYGTNGFYLPFTNTTSTTTLGYDSSGNGNNWTPNNISLTAGATYDSMTDVPTLTSATAANYATLNPLKVFSTANGTFADGNLTFSGPNTSVWYSAQSSITMSSGKWYFEATIVTSTSSNSMVGIAPTSSTNANVGVESNTYSYLGSNGTKQNNNTQTAYGATYTAGDVIGAAFDATNGTLTFYKNNTSQGTAFTGITGEYAFVVACNPNTIAVNFGQRPFSYTPPSGFVALNTNNIGASTIPNGAAYMAATLYTGNGSTQSVVNTVGSVSFQPDFVWAKNRSSVGYHGQFDSVRGTTKWLISNSTNAESTLSGVTAFNSNGFSLGADYNASPDSFVAWQWKGGGTAVSNTNGSITSSVSANTTSGFSVATYTGTGVAGTIGHGLGVAPSMIIVKSRSAAGDWPVYHSTLGNSLNLLLNIAGGTASSSTIWNATSPTSSVFSVGINTTSNTVTVTYVAYCFAAIKGFSAFGSYTGNGSTDGTFIYTGFRPRWLLIKNTSTVNYWELRDTSRNPANTADLRLSPNISNAESASSPIDILANGFKIRGTDDGVNGNTYTYIYAAFAENPFQNALAR